MTIIVFLIDTSSSMNQRAYLGGRPNLLDVAKGAVETFVKVRQRSPESRGDRYMLLTFEEPPFNIKAGWKENLATFMNELKNLQATGMTTIGAALKNAFDVLNINRMQTGIDTYGQGRCPYYLEPSVIVVITDGGKLSNTTGVQDDLNLPMHSTIPGSELTREPFRWDQRLFSLVLRLAGTPAVERDIGLVPSDTSSIDAMCEVTGGRSYSITSHRMLMQCIDSLVQKVHSGVIIKFEKIGPDPPTINENAKGDAAEAEGEFDGVSETREPEAGESNSVGPPRIEGSVESVALGKPPPSLSANQNGAVHNPSSRPQAQNANVGANNVPPLSSLNSVPWQSCRKLIYVPRSAQKGFAVGHWPIPESFWPDLSASSLPPRYAHPNVKFMCTSQEPMVIQDLPFDKYELEPSPLTQFILSRKQPTVCWQVFVSNSYKNSEVGHPFGYLKASTNLTCVNLFVMPYNYPVLLPLLEELFKNQRLKPTNEWRLQFSNYLRTMPSYYAGPLRRALTRMGAPSLAQSLIPDAMENSLSYSVLNYLKRLKNQAKIEFDKLCNDVGKTRATAPDGIRVISRSPLKKELLSHPALTDKFPSLREQLSEFPGFYVGLRDRSGRQQSYRNPFDINRRSLLDQVVRMRANLLQPTLSHTRLQDEDISHSMPVSQMGNYQEYLKRLPSQLREIESTPVRQHMFGNPFKIDKRMMVDEADIDLVGGSNQGKGTKRMADTQPGSPRPNKRKPGPIPRDVCVRRPSTPVPSPASPPDVSPPPSPSPTPPVTIPAPSVALSNGIAAVVAEGQGSIVPGITPLSPAPIHEEPPNLIPLINGEISTCPFDDIDERSPSPPTLEADVPSLPITNHVDALGTTPLVLANHVDDSPNRNVATTNGGREVSPVRLTTEDLLKIKQHNQQVRTAAYREVRKPGLNFEQLFHHLRTLKGDVDVRKAVVQEVIKESLRFKRRTLAELLETYMKAVGENSSDYLIPTPVIRNNCVPRHQNNNVTRPASLRYEGRRLRR